MTSDPFERHGIDHLSPSSLRLYREAPAVWVGKYLLKAADEVGPGAWRGLAVEAAVDQMLYGQPDGPAVHAMMVRWGELAQGEIAEAIEREGAALPDFYLQAKSAFAGWPVPLQRQAKTELPVPGISVPLVGYSDWIWPDRGVDLKTTWRMPSQPDTNHVQQVTCYSLYHGVPFSLVYCTPKKWTRYEVTQQMASEAWERVIETAHAIRSMLAHCDSGADALSMFSPDYTSFYFSPPMIEAVRAAKAARVLPAEPRPPRLELVSEPALEGDEA